MPNNIPVMLIVAGFLTVVDSPVLPRVIADRTKVTERDVRLALTWLYEHEQVKVRQEKHGDGMVDLYYWSGEFSALWAEYAGDREMPEVIKPKHKK